MANEMPAIRAGVPITADTRIAARLVGERNRAVVHDIGAPHHEPVVFLSTVLLPLAAPSRTISAQTAGTWVCTARDASRQAGFVNQLFNVSQADAAKLDAAWNAAIKQYGVTPAAGSDSAQAEMSQAKAYCVQNHSGLYDCDGYAKAVHDHRVAHPDEWITDIGGRRIVPIHDLEVGITYHLDCSNCLNDQMLASWARQQVRHNFSAAVIGKVLTQPEVDAYADSVAKAFVPKMHARPNVEDYQRNFNDASAACGSPH